jgi:uncharacterized glyoxalase superfamily protein PhnB
MPRFLQITTAAAGAAPAPRTPEHIATMQKLIGERIEKGHMLATGGIGKRATSAARIVRKDGKITVEDPPVDGANGGGWMAGGGYALTSYDTKEEAIADAKRTLDMMGEGMMELIQVSEMHPAPKQAIDPGTAAPSGSGVIPYLNLEQAAEAVEFYKKAFGATELARMPAQDGKRLMHCHLRINGGDMMISSFFPESGFPPTPVGAATMQLILSEGDKWWKRAVDAGCTVQVPFELAFWGDKYGRLVDPFGVAWAISEPKK